MTSAVSVRRFALAGALALSSALSFSLPAKAENLLASDPSSILAVMQSEGYIATLGRDDQGDPMIESRLSDSEFKVYFYGCDAGRDCLSVQLSAGYDLDAPTTAGLVNEWNRDNRYSRAFIDDEGDPFLRIDVKMQKDGNGVQNFIETLDIWRRLVEDFERYINW